MSFAREAIDLSSARNIIDFKMLKKKIPKFWDMLQSILKYDSSIFFPEDVARIVMHLVTVRNRTFNQAEKAHNLTTLNVMKLVSTQLHATQIPPPRIYPQRYSIIEQADRGI